MSDKKSYQKNQNMWYRKDLETKGTKMVLAIMDQIQKAKQDKRSGQ